jgi:catechol 2,3-dioxygenase-like lactoylglutathione lyase family enzyme
VKVRTTGIDHVVWTVPDVEGVLRWYRDELGLEPLRVEEWRAGKVPFVSLRVSEGTLIDLLEGERTGENVNHIALVLEGVDLEELAASGRFEVEMGPADLFGARGQGRGLYVRDPAGNRVELRTYA